LTRVLLVGSGAREHAIAESLAKSPDVQLYAAMSSRNPGIMKLATESSVLQIDDPQAVAGYAERKHVELAVVGPEAPLVNGITDAFDKMEVMSVGPTGQLARLEGDKAFCRELLSRNNIPGNPIYRVFTDIESATTFLKTAGPVAIKPAGLTSGKGVKVTGEDLKTKNAELEYARDVLHNRIGGVQKLVVEERLEGEEFSLQAFVDGHDIIVMPLVQDHKRAYENDYGPNTGGMGSYSDSNLLLPFVTSGHLEISSKIMLDVVHALYKETGQEYRGILYGQFMLAKSELEEAPGPKLIEFNCRFGDPEAMNVLSTLSEDTNFAEVCLEIAEGNMKRSDVTFLRNASVCKYLVPSGYPEHADIGKPIVVDQLGVERCGARLLYGSVNWEDGKVLTTSSRTIGLVGIGNTLQTAERIAEEATAHISGPLRHRRDIGTASLLEKRINHMKSLGANLSSARIPQVRVV
jgi:phosphoribosylamine--glycine ligase